MRAALVRRTAWLGLLAIWLLYAGPLLSRLEQAVVPAGAFCDTPHGHSHPTHGLADACGYCSLPWASPVLGKGCTAQSVPVMPMQVLSLGQASSPLVVSGLRRAAQPRAPPSSSSV